MLHYIAMHSGVKLSTGYAQVPHTALSPRVRVLATPDTATLTPTPTTPHLSDVGDLLLHGGNQGSPALFPHVVQSRQRLLSPLKSALHNRKEVLG